MNSRSDASGLIFAGGILAAFGAMALVLVPLSALDSRDLLVMALAAAGVIFAVLAGREVLPGSQITNCFAA